MNYKIHVQLHIKLRMNQPAFQGLFTVSFTWAFESEEGIFNVAPRTWLSNYPIQSNM
jgi:hypothetical protein